MSEFMFVVKCFVFTAILVVMMQLRVGGSTIEAHSFHWLRRSSVSQYIQSVAAGGAMAIRSAGNSVRDAASEPVNGFKQGASEQQAHR
jgi:hypothetical protein